MNLVPTSNDFPAPSVWTANGRALLKAGRDIQAAEVVTWTKAELERQKVSAVSDVAAYQLALELNLLELGTRVAGDSPVAQLLVARKVAVFCETNNQRLAELFGGL